MSNDLKTIISEAQDFLNKINIVATCLKAQTIKKEEVQFQIDVNIKAIINTLQTHVTAEPAASMTAPKSDREFHMQRYNEELLQQLSSSKSNQNEMTNQLLEYRQKFNQLQIELDMSKLGSENMHHFYKNKLKE